MSANEKRQAGEAAIRYVEAGAIVAKVRGGESLDPPITGHPQLLEELRLCHEERARSEAFDSESAFGTMAAQDPPRKRLRTKTTQWQDFRTCPDPRNLMCTTTGSNGGLQ